MQGEMKENSNDEAAKPRSVTGGGGQATPCSVNVVGNGKLHCPQSEFPIDQCGDPSGIHLVSAVRKEPPDYTTVL